MMRSAFLATSAGLCALALLFLPASAHGLYLDPGTGSIIIQALLAGLVGLATVTKLYWNKIKGLLGRHRTQQTDSATPE